VLDWLDVELCDALTGDGNAVAMLEVLVRRSLFLVPLEGGERLRYHHLFADLLRYRLRSEPGAEAQLRRRAAAWLLSRGHVADAVEQLLAAGEPGRVAAVIMEHGQGFFEKQETATLARWLGAARRQDPDLPAGLDVNLLAAQLACHQTAEAVETYRRLRRRPGLSPGETAAAAALYSCLGLDDLPSIEVRKAASEAIDLLHRFADEVVINFIGVGGRDTVEFFAEAMLAVAMLHDGDLDDSARQFESVLDLPGAQYLVWKVHSIGGLALTNALLGHAVEARTLASAALDLAAAHGLAEHPGVVYAHFALAQVALDGLDRTAATAHLDASGTLVKVMGRAAFVSFQHLFDLDAFAIDHRPEEVLARLRSSSAPALEPSFVGERRRAREVRLLLAARKGDQARRLLGARPRTPELVAAVIDVELDAGDVDAARRALDEWATPSAPRAATERLLRTAAVLAAEGHPTQAAAALRAALDVAERQELRRPFLEHPVALRMLRAEAARGSGTFARSILDASPTVERSAAAQLRLVEPLTDREMEVLGYLPTRLSNSDMASALFVSVNTLKSHVSHIYTKLGVADRDAAVATADELGLL